MTPMLLPFLAGPLLFAFQGAVATQATPVVETGLREALQARLEAFVADSKVPGVSAGVVTADGTAFALAAGLADPDEKVALRPDDRLCAGSCGKTFVAARSEERRVGKECRSRRTTHHATEKN